MLTRAQSAITVPPRIHGEAVQFKVRYLVGVFVKEEKVKVFVNNLRQVCPSSDSGSHVLRHKTLGLSQHDLNKTNIIFVPIMEAT